MASPVLPTRIGAPTNPAPPRQAAKLPPPPGHTPAFRLIETRALRPGAAQLAANPRSRSARLRALERLPSGPDRTLA